LGQSVLFEVSITFLRSAVLAILAITSSLSSVFSNFTVRLRTLSCSPLDNDRLENKEYPL